MKKLVAVVCLAALVAGAGYVGFTIADRGGDEAAESQGVKAPVVTGDAGMKLPETDIKSDEANQLMQLNQIVFEVAQQNARLPKDQRMSTEEIKALIRQRVQELQAQ